MSGGAYDRDVAEHARRLLREAGVGQRLPTPVDDLVACAELVVSRDAVLDEASEEFFADRLGVLRSALRKTLGIVDLRDDTIYLAPDVLPHKQSFLKLHEVGHKVLPWHRHLYLYLDDEKTLSPEVKGRCEMEANRFAADVLFQVDRFARHARDLPLELETPLSLAGMYGSSAHAAIRRYVQVSHRCCSLLVLKKPRDSAEGEPALRVAYRVESDGFARRFGELRWPARFGPTSPLTAAVLTGRRCARGDDLVLVDRDGRPAEYGFHVFQNAYDIFALIFPLSETLRRSRSKVRKRIIRM